MKLKLLNAVMRLHESNIRNLHWNSAGEVFNDAHKEITTEYYELLSNNVDKTAELLAMFGINAPNYIEVIQTIKEAGTEYMLVNSNKLYNRAEIIKIMDDIFNDIIIILTDILEDEEMQQTENAGVKSELETMLFTFDFQRRYINRRRSM